MKKKIVFSRAVAGLLVLLVSFPWLVFGQFNENPGPSKGGFEPLSLGEKR